MSIGNPTPESEVCRNLRERLRRLRLALELVLSGLPLAKSRVIRMDTGADPAQLDSPGYCLQRQAAMQAAMNMPAAAAYQVLYDSLTERAELEAQIASVNTDLDREGC